MDTTAISNTTASAGQPASQSRLSQQTTASKVDYDAFLKLLVAQMRNQDPTKPTDSAEYLSQIASFSSVEQQISANQRLDSLISLMAFQQGSTMLGKTVAASGLSGASEVVGVEQRGGLVQLQLSNGSTVSPEDVTSVWQGA
jgi:flagellar basal-body rod modification protein FlgD